MLEMQSYAYSLGKSTKRDLPLLKYFATAKPLPPYYYTNGNTKIISYNYHWYLRICYAGGQKESLSQISVIKGENNKILE